VLIGGFIVTGNQPKKVLVRGLGPSLGQAGISNALADPVLELHSGSATLQVSDNWQDDAAQAAQVTATGIPPQDALESALVTTLDPGAYTAILRGKDDGVGVGLVEIYDLDQSADGKLANISTRGYVDTGDNVMIGGFIVVGQSSRVIIRATGPSLATFGINNALSNPQLELHDANGTLAGNDDWQTTQLGGIITSDQSGAIQNSGFAPGNPAESAIIATLAPGSYTAIAQGVNGGTGVGLIEVFALP
jgi:hypothetical protein